MYIYIYMHTYAFIYKCKIDLFVQSFKEKRKKYTHARKI